MDADVLIIGAGLAGLAAAREVTLQGRHALVLESSDDVGGRVRTDVVDGMRLDRGFQLFNPSYPEARRVLDLDALDLCSFTAGVDVRLDSGHAVLADPRTAPGLAWASLTAAVGSGRSKLRFVAYAASRATRSPASLRAEEDTTSLIALRRAGIDERMIDSLLRPFLAGVFLEDRLETSRRFLDLVLRSFVRGTPCVPALGMGAIPAQLAGALPAGTVRLGSTVTRVSATQVECQGQILTAPAVIVAADPVAAGRLLPGIGVPEGRAVTTFYHLAHIDREAITRGRPILVVDGRGRGPLVNAVALTHAARSYAPDGWVLVSSSTLGVADTRDAELGARDHLADLLGIPPSVLEHVATRPIPYALPAMDSPLNLRRPVEIEPGLYAAGDHRDTASIQGALVSGRRAAEAACAHLNRRSRS